MRRLKISQCPVLLLFVVHIVLFPPSLMIQESGNKGSSGPVSVSAADIIAVSGNGKIRTIGKVQVFTNNKTW